MSKVVNILMKSSTAAEKFPLQSVEISRRHNEPGTVFWRVHQFKDAQVVSPRHPSTTSAPLPSPSPATNEQDL